MLLAYIDEIGELGAFVDHDHPRFNTSPAFGYAGFIIPAEDARRFGSIFDREKRTLFATEISTAAHPGRWERKGSSIFRPKTADQYPQQIRVFNHLVKTAGKYSGQLFYYAAEKPLGTPKQTNLQVDEREQSVMRETLNRLARHAESQKSSMMVIIDQVNEKQRAQRLPQMYEHILGRAGKHPEMRRLIEPPMHVDSQLSANIQFADWVAAYISRAIDYQLIEKSPYRWVTTSRELSNVPGSFTYDSKLYLWERPVKHFHNSDILRPERRIFPRASGQLIGSQTTPDNIQKMKAVADRNSARQRSNKRDHPER